MMKNKTKKGIAWNNHNIVPIERGFSHDQQMRLNRTGVSAEEIPRIDHGLIMCVKAV